MKKIIPTDHINNSHSNFSTSDNINPSGLHQCRFCKKTETPDHSPNSFLYPCHCPEPLHTACIIDEMEKSLLGEILSQKKQKHYNCAKCQHNIRFVFQSSLKCRPFCGLGQYICKRKCLCSSIVIATLFLFALIALLIAIKTSRIQFNSSVLCSTTNIGVTILIVILFLIIGYLFVSQIMLEEERKVNLLAQKGEKHHRKHSSRLEIVDCS